MESPPPETIVPTLLKTVSTVRPSVVCPKNKIINHLNGDNWKPHNPNIITNMDHLRLAQVIGIWSWEYSDGHGDGTEIVEETKNQPDPAKENITGNDEDHDPFKPLLQ